MIRAYLVLQILIFCLASSAEIPNGLYQVQGKGLHGPYQGQVLVNAPHIQRLVRFTNYKHMNHFIETAWSGRLQNQKAVFVLGYSNVMTSFDGYSPKPLELQKATMINADLSDLTRVQMGNDLENWTLIEASRTLPLWQDLRTRISAVSNDESSLITLARWLGINKVIEWYANQAINDPWRERPEFKDLQQWFVQDRTDWDFYQTHKEGLRIHNKTINPLSLAEARLRRNAYGKRLFEKAEILDRDTRSKNLNSAGLLESVTVNSQDQIINTHKEVDSCLWTAMYGWSQLLKYKNIKDPQALNNFKKVLTGLITLVDIPGQGDQFARTLAVSPASQNLGSEWIQGVGKFSHLKWIPGGNNDMAKGLLITFAIAQEVIEDPVLKQEIARVSKSLLKLKAIHSREFNLGLAYGLVALWNNDKNALKNYLQRADSLQSQMADWSGVDSGFYVGGIADWSGIHLSMISALSQLVVANGLQKKYQSHEIQNSLKAAQKRLLEMHQTYRMAKRDFLTIITGAYVPKEMRPARFEQELENALWVLHEVPAPRSIGAVEADLRLQPHWSPSAWPRMPWKALSGPWKLKKDANPEFHMQGAYGYPIFEFSILGSNYLWKDNPFSFKNHTPPGHQDFSADYLLLYWMARNAGLIKAED